MSLTAREICRDADLFRAALPSWPHPEPSRPAEITASSPVSLTEDERQMLLEDRWRDSL